MGANGRSRIPLIGYVAFICYAFALVFAALTVAALTQGPTGSVYNDLGFVATMAVSNLMLGAFFDAVSRILQVLREIRDRLPAANT